MSDDESNVIDMRNRRKQDKGYYVCEWGCGSAYFWIEAVTLSSDGGPAGYSGFPVCISCGRVQSNPAIYPEGVEMPCGNCDDVLIMPRDKDHACGV